MNRGYYFRFTIAFDYIFENCIKVPAFMLFHMLNIHFKMFLLKFSSSNRNMNHVIPLNSIILWWLFPISRFGFIHFFVQFLSVAVYFMLLESLYLNIKLNVVFWRMFGSNEKSYTHIMMKQWNSFTDSVVSQHFFGLRSDLMSQEGVITYVFLFAIKAVFLNNRLVR